MYIFPTQNVGAANASDATIAPALAAQVSTRTFWATATADIGSYGTIITNAADAAADTGHPSGSFWVVCLNAASLLVSGKCSGVGGNATATSSTAVTKSRYIPGRLTIIADFNILNADIQIGNQTNTSAKVQGAFKYDFDILTASLYHSSGTLTDNTIWCTAFRNVLDPAATTPVTLKAALGLTGKSKCTWALIGTSAAAPSLKFTVADYRDFLFGWIEYATDAQLGSNAFMPATDAAPFHLGAYTASNGPFLNPVLLTAGDSGATVGWPV